MRLKDLRKMKGLTQAECAAYLGVPLRTYQNYEKYDDYGSAIKSDYMYNTLEKFGFVDEEHGILTLKKIRETCKTVFDGKPVEYCYLFGSYAKGAATETSDIDLLVSTEITGIGVYALCEELRVELNKKVDLLTLEQLSNNAELLNEILKYGIKIYG